MTMLGVLWFAVIEAVLLAVLRFVHIAARPDVELLGLQAGIRGFHDLRFYPHAGTLPGLVLFRFAGPPAFFNASCFRSRVLDAAAAAGPALRAVIVDAAAVSTREDATAVFMLAELRRRLESRGVRFALAGNRHLIERWLRKRGLATDSAEGRGGPWLSRHSKTRSRRSLPVTTQGEGARHDPRSQPVHRGEAAGARR